MNHPFVAQCAKDISAEAQSAADSNDRVSLVDALYERGNTENDELDVAGKTVWRSLEDRYTIKVRGEFDESNGVKNKQKWAWSNKYDRFLSDPDNYIGLLLGLEHDKFANRKLRTRIGPYMGRQFFETSLLSLQGELGVVYVDEQFEDETEDNDYPGANWALHLTSDIVSGVLGTGSSFYVDQVGLLNFDDTEGVAIDTVLGVALPLYKGFETRAEIKWEYDGGATDNVDDLDETYTLRFGYSW